MPDFTPQPITPQQVIDTARGFLGKPYVPFGRGNAGMDCVDVMLLTGIALGQLPANIYSLIPPYSQNSLPRFLDLMWQYLDEIAIEDITPGCGYLLCHDPAKNTRPKHIAIATDQGMLGVSILRSVDKVCEHPLSQFYAQKVVGGWKYRGMVVQ